MPLMLSGTVPQSIFCLRWLQLCHQIQQLFKQTTQTNKDLCKRFDQLATSLTVFISHLSDRPGNIGCRFGSANGFCSEAKGYLQARHIYNQQVEHRTAIFMVLAASIVLNVLLDESYRQLSATKEALSSV